MPDPLLPPSVTPVAIEFQSLTSMSAMLLAGELNPLMVPRLTFLRSPAGWWTAVNAAPLETVLASTPAKMAPVGGVLFRRSSSASKYAFV